MMGRRKRTLKDLDRDIRDHLARETQDNIERGMPPEEARYAALRKFGNVTQVKGEVWDVWSLVWLEQVLQDARLGLRTLWRSPGLTLAAVLAVTLGVGANVAVFSVLSGFTLRLLPVPGAEEIVSVNQIFHKLTSRNTHGETSMFSYSEYLNYRDHNHAFTGLAAYEPFVEATLAGGNGRLLLGTATSCNYFEVLNEHPAQGRAFVESDCTSAGEKAVVVVSDDLWRGQFSSDPLLVGKRITLNHTAYTVIGVARPGFRGTEPVPSEFWAPVTMQRALEPGMDRLADDNMSWLALLGRVQPGISMNQVRADLGVIAGRIDRLSRGRTTSLAIHPATFFDRPEEREAVVPISAVIVTAFGLLLLLACANVANLLLSRASVRHKEVALRQAMGASRWRLVRQMLTESLLLSLMGGLLGSILACLSIGNLIRFVVSHLPVSFPTLDVNVAPDLRVAAYALSLTAITGIAFGLMPALQSSRFDLSSALKESGVQSGSANKSRQLLRNTLVGAQIAVSMILLLAVGLLIRGLYYAQTVDPGFATKDVAALFLNLGAQAYDKSRATAVMQQLRDRVSRVPGVLEVAQAECAPLSHDFSADHFTIPGRSEKFAIEYNHVSPEYFSVVGIPILRGRGFTAEAPNSAGVIVTEATARRLWPGEEPLARTLRADDGEEYYVIGVAKDAQVSHLGELDTNYLYFLAGPNDNSRNYLLIRFRGDFSATSKGVRAAVRSLDAEVPADLIRLEDYLEIWRAPSRIVAALSGALGALALLLASIGVYGMVSYSVSRSVREIGIRLAVGASRADVMAYVLWRAMRPILIGGLVGMIVSAALSTVLSSMLFGLSAHDPIAFIAVPLFLFVVAAIASFVPARRAMHVDPNLALRCE
jgi:predicted permease